MDISESRFWAKVERGDDNDCWDWTGWTGNGYGRFRVGDDVYGAHRIAFMLDSDTEMVPDKMVLHECHNRSCVNPSHLYLGDKSDNLRDAKEAGDWDGPGHTFPRGHENPSHSGLTDDELTEIRGSDARQVDLAAEYDVSQSRISQIQRGDDK